MNEGTNNLMNNLNEVYRQGAKVNISINDVMDDIQLNMPYDEFFYILKGLKTLKIQIIDDIKNDTSDDILVEFQNNVYDCQAKDNIFDVLKQIDGMIKILSDKSNNITPY
jgi:hypothetical protein